MPSLKHLRVRINSVKATQKITSAMKMVAASKLRRAQEQAEAARPYAGRMERMVNSIALTIANDGGGPILLRGTDSDATHLLVVAIATTNRWVASESVPRNRIGPPPSFAMVRAIEFTMRSMRPA